jgi:hypothetical protein
MLRALESNLPSIESGARRLIAHAGVCTYIVAAGEPVITLGLAGM